VAERKRRADAERNVVSILDAAVDRLAASPDASMTDIARAAGVGRVTLYGHFASREELRAAAMEHIAGQAHTAFDALDLDSLPPAQALEHLLRTSWRVIERHHAFFTAVMHATDHHHLSRDHHEPLVHRVDHVIRRGQAEGVFRTDLDRAWLVTACLGLVHAAVRYAEAGHSPDDAVEVLISTSRAVLLEQR
jgi:AcrR family transcriptional regulator